MAPGRLTLVLSSRKVLARIEEFKASGVSSWNGRLLPSSRRVAVYDYVLDDEQIRALSAAREIASRAGLALEVVDLSRQNPLRRLLRLGMSGMNAEGLAGYGISRE